MDRLQARDFVFWAEAAACVGDAQFCCDGIDGTSLVSRQKYNAKTMLFQAGDGCHRVWPKHIRKLKRQRLMAGLRQPDCGCIL